MTEICGQCKKAIQGESFDIGDDEVFCDADCAQEYGADMDPRACIN